MAISQNHPLWLKLLDFMFNSQKVLHNTKQLPKDFTRPHLPILRNHMPEKFEIMLFCQQYPSYQCPPKTRSFQEYSTLLFITSHAGDEREMGYCLWFGSYMAWRQDWRADVSSQCAAGCTRGPAAELHAVSLHAGHVGTGFQLCSAGNWARLGMISRLGSRK